MFKKILFVCVVLSVFIVLKTQVVQAAGENYSVQHALTGIILQESSKLLDDSGKILSISFKVKLDNNSVIIAQFQPGDLNHLNLNSGEKIVLTESTLKGKTQYSIVDNYRIPSLIYFLVGFAFISILLVGRKGIGSLLGLLLSLVFILYGIVPLILKGFDPLLVTISFSILIIFVTTYLAHGVSKQTTIALVSTCISLFLTLVASYLSVQLLSLNGLGSEDVYNLYLTMQIPINTKGLLLSGIIIATLGALNDVTITQATTIYEMKKIDNNLKFLDLFKKGLSIGREHGASMVNTIVLAYAGTSLFVFIFFLVNPQKLPIWAILNNEMMVEEIVKTLGGTIGILFSVPIVTVLAAYIFGSLDQSKNTDK